MSLLLSQSFPGMAEVSLFPPEKDSMSDPTVHLPTSFFMMIHGRLFKFSLLKEIDDVTLIQDTSQQIFRGRFHARD